MRKRKSFNPKRRLCPEAEFVERRQAIEDLVKHARYGGNPEHKRNPGDFGLEPPSSPRLDKSLCDDASIHSRGEALDLLKNGLKRGLVSVQERDGWPQNIWAVTTDGQPMEAQLEGNGTYHGYPMPRDDPFREGVLTRWNRS